MNEDLINYLNSIRRDFSGKPLTENSVQKNPFSQFEIWFEEAVNSEILDPYAMSISTVNKNGQPTTRIVYLRDLTKEGLIFYTNYLSEKGQNLKQNNKLAANFFWGELERQIRIEGEVKKVENAVSDLYFSKRPRESQIGAWASDQSTIIENRNELEKKIHFFTEKFKGKEIPRPDNWGGYIIKPTKMEFWQGRASRLHDRILFTKENNNWKTNRLSP